MLANDMKKGQKGKLKNGWNFQIQDNLKGVIRMAKVWGFETETGSIYVHDIAWVDMPDGGREAIEFTPAQALKIKNIKAWGF
jgi:hypothetical protein